METAGLRSPLAHASAGRVGAHLDDLPAKQLRNCVAAGRGHGLHPPRDGALACLPASETLPVPPARLQTASCPLLAPITRGYAQTHLSSVRLGRQPAWLLSGPLLGTRFTAADASQGNLAIAQGRVPELDFEQDRFRDASAVAADLKEADLAHHAERLSVQRLQHSPLFLGQQASEHKSHLFSQLFPVRFPHTPPKSCPCCSVQLLMLAARRCIVGHAHTRASARVMLARGTCSERTRHDCGPIVGSRASVVACTHATTHAVLDLACAGHQRLPRALHRREGDHIGRTRLSHSSRSDSATVSTRRLSHIAAS